MVVILYELKPDSEDTFPALLGIRFTGRHTTTGQHIKNDASLQTAQRAYAAVSRECGAKQINQSDVA